MATPKKQPEYKTTQGQLKTRRYIEELIRNKYFLRKVKRYRKSAHPLDSTKGNYSEWTGEQRARADHINREIGEIIESHEKLKERCQKLFGDNQTRIAKQIAYEYGLDLTLLQVAVGLIDGNNFYPEFRRDETDLCILRDLEEDFIRTFNKGDDMLHLHLDRMTRFIAYPLWIGIHKKASKKDLLDYVEKRWPWIDCQLRMAEEKALKFRLKGRRKYSQAVGDLIWSNRNLPAQKIKLKLDVKFPDAGLVYYEINDILKQEKKKRLGKLS